MKISLMVMSVGNSAGKTLPINVAQFIIGRDPQCNLRPGSAMISKRHCAVLVKNGQVFLRDFDSTNGTFVNDQQVKGEVPLHDGDVLKVGPLSFKVVIEGVPAPKKSTATTPPPVQKTAAGTDDDAAASLLSTEEDAAPEGTAAMESADDHIPEGSTVMDIPMFKPTEEPAPPKEADTVKVEERKPKLPKSKSNGSAAQDAAKALIERMRSGQRENTTLEQ